MEDRQLVISWKDYPPISAINLWHVKGDIEYRDGKLVFEISNGSRVRINPDQLVRICLTKTEDEIQEEINRIKNK